MIYRTEHPKPQFQRDSWMNLNGSWDFEMDPGRSGEAREMFSETAAYTRTINVPFCMESALSGVAYTDFMPAVWYRRNVTVTEAQLAGRVILHFGAVDYRAVVYVNGTQVGEHRGGYVSFSFDVTETMKAGENVIAVYAEDDSRDGLIPSGKQCMRYASRGCYYTRTTGIWQTVWLEFVPKTYIKKTKYVTDCENGILTVTAELAGSGLLKAEAFYEGKAVGSASVASLGGSTNLTLQLSEIHLWEPGHGRLYDLVLTYGEDRVQSYFGLRTVTLDGYRFLINGQPVFQRLILDQGFYPDGIYTAPSDAELVADIQRSLDMGFNGARLHEKVFEERFLYHCDRMGYLAWGEYPNWGMDHSLKECIYSILPEWLEELERDFNHPAIIGWCPFNETWDRKGHRQYDDALRLTYLATKAADPTRPCIDTSGMYHVLTDIYDLHDYEQDPEVFARTYADFAQKAEYDTTLRTAFADRQTYDKKMPFFISEYGGIRWSDKDGWGYGNAPKSREEFLSRLKGLTDVLMDDPRMFGFCYTQLTDVEQEQNGLYTYDRHPKFSPEEIYPIFARPAAYEDETVVLETF